MKTLEEMSALLDKALGALSDIASAEDMDERTRRRKAQRIYSEIIAELAKEPDRTAEEG